MTARGPDYADRLTDAETRMLALIRNRVESRVVARRRRRTLAPMLAAAAVVAVVAISVAVIGYVTRPTRPVESAAQPAQAAAAISALSHAQPSDGTTPVTTLAWTITQVTIPATTPCGATAVRVSAKATAGTPGDGPIPGRLTASSVPPPDLASGCPSPPVARSIYSGDVPDIRATWTSLAAQHPGMPTFVSPYAVDTLFNVDVRERGIDDLRLGNFVDKQCDGRSARTCAAIRWSDLVTLLTSPELTGPQRATVLAWAAADQTTVDAATAQTGGGSVHLTVPMIGDTGSVVEATLSFDAATGRLTEITRSGAGGGTIQTYVDLG